MAEILITSEAFGRYSGKAKELLEEAGHHVIENPYKHALNHAEIIAHISEADAIICDLERIDADILSHAPQLKIIARRGVGLDSVDLVEADKRGIAVMRTPGIVEKPVAELVMSYILNVSRKVALMNHDMKNNIWRREVGSSLEGKVLGVIGLGNIAWEVIRKAKAFDMEVVYYSIDRAIDKEEEWGITYLEFDGVLHTADFVSIHTPLTDQTRGLFNKGTIAKMKQSAFLINTARGPIVNEQDLAEALLEGVISGAAIDVYDVEPKQDSPLMRLDNVILTPHIATNTVETAINMDVSAAQNIIHFFENVK